jgi:glucosyl-3-phosphoglycerate synthase
MKAPSSTAMRWQRERSFHYAQYPIERLARERNVSVSVCLPARECGHSVGEIVAAMVGLRRRGVIDEIVVVDANSRDGTARIAAKAGATVYQESELLSDFGPALGKGDAMWRALSVMEGDVLCYLDADSQEFEAHFATGVLGPLLCDDPPRVEFVKGFYRRPFNQGGISLPDGGGRVNHLMARPALAQFYPELAGIRQPLAGEIAARRELLERIPFTTGYAVETAMLIDVWREVALDGMAQVDIGTHNNPHQSLHALAPMGYAVLMAITQRLHADGRLTTFAPSPLLTPEGPREVELYERPPMRSVRRDAAA